MPGTRSAPAKPPSESVANSNYNALRKTSGPLTLGVAYTFSHFFDDSSDKFDSNFVDSTDVHKNYASSNFDQRHIFTVSWVYDPPLFLHGGRSRSVLGGWQFAGIMTSQSGTPFSVINGVFGDSAGVANGAARDLMPTWQEMRTLSLPTSFLLTRP